MSAGRPRAARARRALLLAIAGCSVAACSGAPPGLDVAALGLPSTAGATLGHTTLHTSPDGGIYDNPDDLTVVMVARASGQGVAGLLGEQADWSGLLPLGPFTFIAVRLRNDGKAASDPQLGDLQVASDLSPPGTSSGPLRHWYHPMFPLAVLSETSVAGDCSVHLDPGQGALTLLVYPPIRDVPAVTWGRYGDFALRLDWGGGIPARGLHGSPCAPPQAPPSP